MFTPHLYLVQIFRWAMLHFYSTYMPSWHGQTHFLLIIRLQVSAALHADWLASREISAEDTCNIVYSEVMNPVNLKCCCSSNWLWCCSCWKHLSYSLLQLVELHFYHNSLCIIQPTAVTFQNHQQLKNLYFHQLIKHLNNWPIRVWISYSMRQEFPFS